MKRGGFLSIWDTIVRFEHDRVELDDGTTLVADATVTAVGSRPNTEWLAGNGLDLSDGVLCDEHLRVEGHPHVVAVGDVARFPNPRYDDVPRRVEHWGIPGETARHTARALVAGLAGVPVEQPDFALLPTFWSEQRTDRIQAVGMPALGVADIRIFGGGTNGDFVAGYHRGGELVGVVGVGGPRTTAAIARHRGRLRGNGHIRPADVVTKR